MDLHNRIIKHGGAVFYNTSQTLIAGDEGLLVMDESTPTCNERFKKWGSSVWKWNQDGT